MTQRQIKWGLKIADDLRRARKAKLGEVTYVRSSVQEVCRAWLMLKADGKVR